MPDGTSENENETPSIPPPSNSENSRTQNPTRRGPYLESFEKKKIGRIFPHYKEKKIRIKIRNSRITKRLFWVLSLIIFLTALVLSVVSSKAFSLLLIVKKLKNENLLIGFQNSAELRPTGGFWGSFAILKIGKNIKERELLFETNPYKNDNPLLRSTSVELPKPMKETWPDRPQSFVNANWSFNFEEAAKTLEWYFGQGWQTQNSGVIAISSLAVIDLLRLTGPVTTSDGTEINSENFTQILSQKIDTEYWQSDLNKQINEPKTILKEVSPQLIQKTKNIPLLTLYGFIQKQFEEGRVLCYFSDSQKDRLCQKLGLNGKPVPYDKDYLSVNSANLNGGKTSLNVSQSIDYSVGSIERNNLADLKITRYHNTNPWPAILNRNYTRVIAPLGSQLVSAKLGDADITQLIEKIDEQGRTTFGFWFSTSPGETKTAEIQYLLPFDFKNLKDYNLIFQKQPGTIAENLKVTISDKILFEGENNKSLLKIQE